MGNTILMIHGMFCGAWCWEKYKSFFEVNGFNCIAYTLMYHDANPSESPDPRLGTVSLLDYSQELESFIKTLDDRPIIVGHSMGALLSQILASRNLAKALVLLSPAPPWGINPITLRISNLFAEALMNWGFWKKPFRPSYRKVMYYMINGLPPKERSQVYSKMVFESGRAAYEIGMWMFDNRRASFVDEKQVVCPVLVISGREDRVIPLNVSRKVAAKYRAQYMEFSNHSHWLIGEPGWEKISQCVVDWIAGTFG